MEEEGRTHKVKIVQGPQKSQCGPDFWESQYSEI